MQTLLFSALISAVVSIGALFGVQHTQPAVSPAVKQAIAEYVQNAQTAPTFGTTQPIAGQTFNIAGSGVSASASSITLATFTVTQTGQKILDSDLSDTFYITLEPGNSSKQEIVSCTTVVQNANGSATLSGCSRGLSPITPYTASTTLRFSHGGGTQVVFSNPPQFYNEFAQLQNNQTITGIWTYSAKPQITDNANSPFDAVNYQTLLATAISGAGTSTFSTMGIVRLAGFGEVGSSTASSTSGQPLVIENKFATTTPGILCTNNTIKCIVATMGGKISQSFIDLTATFGWSGLHTFSAGLLGTASSTFNPGTLHVGSTVIAPHFGGGGTDGALSASSGTTTIALGTANYYEKNYTSISLTGTAAINFSSAATSSSGVTIVLKSQGACTFTSSSMTMIDLRWLGGGMGTAIDSSATGYGGGGGGSTGGRAVNGSGGNTSPTPIGTVGFAGVQLPALASSTTIALPGGNGTAGTAGTGAAGAAGRGAGGLYIECAGGYTFTTGGFMASGANGVAGTQSSGSGSGGGGGGGGAGGNIFVRYGSLVSNTGTYTTTAGTGGGGGGPNGAFAGGPGGDASAGSHLEVLNSTEF